MDNKTANKKLRSDVQVRWLGLDAGLYDPVTKMMYILNPTAAFITVNMDRYRSAKELASNLRLSIHDAALSEKELQKDVDWVVATLDSYKLLEKTKLLNEDTELSAVITEYNMTSLDLSYIRPSIKPYSLQELRDQSERGPIKPSFGDHWNPGMGTGA